MTLHVRDLGRKIANQWIVRHINFRVENGECLVLLGPSGCGKSTTLRLIAGLDRVQEGSIHINNIDVTTTSPVDI